MHRKRGIMKVFKIEVLVIDFDEVGKEEITYLIENTRYPNHCMSPSVKNIESREITWSDDHPLNLNDKCDAEYARLFGV